jgi:type II secretory ATPase GspE/PulE/Tfp pilus assembly ATPase PilB-like protein
LANLLTYRTEMPQEGRLRENGAEIETRLSTFPTMFGEKAVIRLFAEMGKYHRLGDLNFPPETRDALTRLLDQTAGVILFTGPAGSGKTTTNYACLREILDKSQGRRSLVSLEDPIEVVVEGVDQSQLNPAAGFDMATGLRSLVRQDPEVMMVGEIRDHTTAEIVFQASLTGHLVLTTFHAGSAATAISRLSDMGIEPYLLRSGILAIVGQRLLRRLCACRREASEPEAKLGLPVERAFVAVGCPECAGTGYRGRMVVTEMIEPRRTELGRAILSRSDAGHLEQLAREGGMISQFERACQAIENGLTSAEEVLRVFGTARQSGWGDDVECR